MSIENILRERQIIYLCHFTRLENLESILTHGLICIMQNLTLILDYELVDCLMIRFARITTQMLLVCQFRSQIVGCFLLCVMNV